MLKAFYKGHPWNFQKNYLTTCATKQIANLQDDVIGECVLHADDVVFRLRFGQLDRLRRAEQRTQTGEFRNGAQLL